MRGVGGEKEKESGGKAEREMGREKVWPRKNGGGEKDRKMDSGRERKNEI